MASISEQVIEEVKLYPILFDLSHPECKNTRKKNGIWDEIGKSLSTEGDDVKKNGRTYGMLMLSILEVKKLTRDKRLQLSTDIKCGLGPSRCLFANLFYNLRVRNLNKPNKQQSSPAIAVPTSKNFEKKRRVDTSHLFAQSTSVNKVLDYLENRVSNNQNKDEMDLLFRGYAKTVKKFSAQRQALVKFQIAKILMEEELQQQTEDDSTIISRPTSHLTDSLFSPPSSLPESPILSPQSYNIEETTTKSATRWYEGFTDNVM